MRALVALVVVVAPMTAASAPPSKTLKPAAVLAKVDATYAGAQQLSGSFTQTVTNKTFGKTTRSAGRFYVARPDKMRWDYFTKITSLEKSFIFDGTTLWVVEPANKQVLEYRATSGAFPAAVSFLTGGGSLSKEFTARAPKNSDQLIPGAAVIELTPKQVSAQYTQLLLVIDPTTWTVTRSIVIDANGDTNTFGFSTINLKAKHSANTFQFSPASVPTYKVVNVAPAASTTPTPGPVKPAPAKP